MSQLQLEGLNLPELIDQLAELSVPEPVAYTPETAGWWVLAGLLAIGLTCVVFFALRRRRRNAYRRMAVMELLNLERAPGGASMHDLAVLVRRTALSAYPRQEVAHLHGADWRDFLQRSAGVNLGAGVEGIVDGPYRRDVAGLSVADATASAMQWIETHRA